MYYVNRIKYQECEIGTIEEISEKYFKDLNLKPPSCEPGPSWELKSKLSKLHVIQVLVRFEDFICSNQDTQFHQIYTQV